MMITNPFRFLLLLMLLSMIAVGMGWEEPMYNNPELYRDIYYSY